MSRIETKRAKILSGDTPAELEKTINNMFKGHNVYNVQYSSVTTEFGVRYTALVLYHDAELSQLDCLIQHSEIRGI